ncbi:MAG: WYL domain-containing protein [Acidimicrobiia bacterium]
MNRISRILALIPYVLDKGTATVDDLVARFGYDSDKDLVKDLHLIFMTGLPGYGPGDLIDVDIFDDEVTIDLAEYFARPLRLSPAEALGLLAAGSTFLATGQAPPALTTAMDKLSRAMGIEGDDAVVFDVPVPPIVAELRDAIDASTPITIGYVAIGTNERTERVVEGAAVFFNLGNWYLSGYCRLAKANRTFRVDRIDTVNLLPDRYQRPRSDTGAMVRYEPSPDDAQAVFRVKGQARWIAEYYPVTVEALDSGEQRITMLVSDPVVAARLLNRLGADAVLEDGESVRGALDDLRERIAAKYASVPAVPK